jgi:hypothetical protein
MEKLYTVEEILKIHIEEYNNIQSLGYKKDLYNYQKEPLVKERESIFNQRILEIRKIEVEVYNIIKTKLNYVLRPIYDINTKERLVFNLKSLDSEIYEVIYNTQKIKDYCTRIGHRLPEFHLESFYFDEPKFYKGQKMVIDVNYYGPGSNVMVFYNHIDLKYLENKNHNSNLKYLENKNHNSNCFVVTTVMGDINHPIVEDFRRYRDEVILKTNFGNYLVELYYFVGPVLSKIIKKNRILFNISKRFVFKVHKLIK